MLNQYLTKTCQYSTNTYMNPYLTDPSTNAKLILTLILILRHFAVSLFLALTWKFLTTFDNINSVFHSDEFL